ncbi:MAG TPA: porin family protein [Gemmatimonadales bacterium]|jgi:hypothetical protein|nr:porin family protein [Gemmatimonadales bacterium]
MRSLRSLLLLVLLAPAMPSITLAQGEFGVKAGVSFGNISNKGVLPGDLKTRTGFTGGLYAGYRAAVLGFDVEGLYAQRGARSDESFATAETKLDFIDVPVYVKAMIPAGGIQPFVYAGPQISFEVRCRTAAGAECAANSPRKKTDYAGVVGAGLRFGSSSAGLGIEGRYIYGLRNLDVSTVTSSTSYKTRTFEILVSLGK